MKKHNRDRQLNNEAKENLDKSAESFEAEETVEAAEAAEEDSSLTDKDEVESAFEADEGENLAQGEILSASVDAVVDEKAIEEATDESIEAENEDIDAVVDEEATDVATDESIEAENEDIDAVVDEDTTDEATDESTDEADEDNDADEDSDDEEDNDDEDEDEKKDKEESEKEKSALYMFFDTVKFVAIGLLIGILLVVFVVQRNDVYGSSMEPTLHTGDAVFVEMISVYTGNFSRGDIITIDAKGMDGYAHEENLIKRIVGLPGETIKIADGNVYINGELLDESDYLPAGTMTYVGAEGQARGYDEITLGPDEYYCMGDNRGGSNDSRRMGPFKKSQIDAKVLMRIYPFNKMKFF
ncbi:MAG: signal peptidase I [Clostridiales bacterium]|nr:signal peptidase I [Clostridiales bacterium]